MLFPTVLLNYDRDARAIYKAFESEPQPARKLAINDCVAALKAAGVWTKLDVLYMFAAADSQAAKINWKNPATFNASEVSSPTFTIDGGFAGNGSSSYLNTTFDIALNASQYTLNSAHMMMTTTTSRATGGTLGHGVLNTNAAQVLVVFNSTNDFSLLNTNSGGGGSDTQARGSWIINRPNSSFRDTYYNGALVHTYTNTASAVPASGRTVYIGARNNAGTADLFSNDQVSAFSIGGGFPAREQSNVTAAIFNDLVATGAFSFETETNTLAAAFTTPPTATRKALINACIKALKDAGVWSKLDAFYIFAAADSQAALINWKNPGTFNATATSSPTFTADRGYTGNASTSYIDTTYNPFSSGGQFAANDATMFAWNLASSASGTSPLFGGDAGSFRNQGFPNISTNTYRAAIGDSAIQIDYTSNTTKPGLYSASRTASNALASYRNGASVGTDTTAASTGLPNENLSFLRSHVFFGDWQISGGGFGKGLNSTEHAALYSALLAYLQAVGAV